jgi:hypothetical protein
MSVVGLLVIKPMSQMGHSRRSDRVPMTSGLPRPMDINASICLVRFVPNSEVSLLRKSRSKKTFLPLLAILNAPQG